MKRFKNILYVLDEDSIDRQDGALKVAELARLNNAKVTVIFAQESNFLDDLSWTMAEKLKELHHLIVTDRSERLDMFFNAPHWDGVDVATDSSSSVDFIAIIRKVIRQGFDLVIKEAALNQGIDSLSMRLVRKCPCPVWVMKSGPTNFKRILAAIDVGETDAEAIALNKKIIEITNSLAQREGGKAHYLHSWRWDYESMLTGPRFNVSTQDARAIKGAIFNERKQNMLSLLEDNHIHFENEQLHLREGVSSDVIQQAIEDLDIDVVVMGSVARSGIPGLLIGNKAEKLLNSINRTVLTVKPDGFKSPVTLD